MIGSNNLKVSVNLGLQETYGVFKLNSSVAENNINIDVYTSGKTYVESEETSVMHGGESGYTQFEGVYPIDSTTWDLTNLGKVYIDKLSTFFKSDIVNDNIEGAEGSEMYDNGCYDRYKNQFLISFEDLQETQNEEQNQELEDSQEDLNETILYYDYQHNVVSISDTDAHISKTWGEINGLNYLYGKVKIINISKYYSIYAIDNTVQSPLLRPLLYNSDDLEKYNLDIDNNNIPYIKYLWGLTFYFGGDGSRDDDSYIYNRIYLYNSQEGKFSTEDEDPVASSNMSWDEDDNVKDLSPFNTNLGNIPTLRGKDLSWWDTLFPKGFVLFGMINEGGTDQTFNKDGKRTTSQIRYSLPTLYKETFYLADYTYSFDKKHIRGDGDTPLMGLVYNGDSVGNIHFLNNWFPVTAGKWSEPRQEISYKDGMLNLHPRYIGLAIASVLANIYVYTDTVGNSISYTSDIIYLKNYNTIYTKDVIYKVSSKAENTNELIAFHGFTLKSYIEALESHLTNSEKEQLSHNNVTAVVKSCIKNAPILFKMGYIQPGLESIGVKSARAKVRTIDGKEYDVTMNSNSKEDLYLINMTNQGIIADIINNKFRVKYLSSLKYDGNLLRGEFDLVLPEEVCPDIYKTFKLEGDLLGFKITSYTGLPNYSIVTDFFEDMSYTHLIKSEVMVPFAKLF